MKRVLIYRSVTQLKPTGGPSGYLYNLKKGLDKLTVGEVQFDFLPAVQENTALKAQAKSSKNPVVKSLLSLYRLAKHAKGNLTMLKTRQSCPVDLNDYDAVHFHITRDMYFLRDELENYKGKVILTSHSPQPLSNEFIETSTPIELKLFGKEYAKLIQMDEYAFRRADYIVFPCAFADEPYEHAWEEYSEIKAEKAESYRYLLTGTVPANPRKSRDEMRKQYGIPEDAYVVSYVGRHSEIKGYDRLKEIGKELLDRHPNLYVFVAGNIGPLTPVEHERWIEVGWTNDPHSVVAASDVFVLPNKETYFDLVMLEVLSTGTAVVASNTGGNKYFAAEPGVKLYDTQMEAVALVEEMMQYDPQKRAALEAGNRALFNEHFTTDIFAEHYVDLIKSIL